MSETDYNIFFLMPCHNEQGRVGRVVSSVRATFPHANIIVIDDCSTDDSASEARSSGAIVLSHICNLGYGAALQTGYMYALAEGCDILVQLDADGQHLTQGLADLIEPISRGDADLCIGSRHLSGSSSDTPLVRRLGQRLFSLVIRVFGGPALSDPTSGYQAMNARTLSLFASDVFPCDYPDSDVILMTHYAGLRITEIPALMTERSGGTSIHSGLTPIYYGIKMLFAMVIVLLNRHKWQALADKLGSSSTTSKSEGIENAS